MLLAIGLVVVVIGTVLFNFLSPSFTPLASNWGQIDFTLNLTIAMTGIVFVVINLLMAYFVLRYRQQPGKKAAFEPENKKLELWLIGVTAIGVVVLLAPGLFVYSEFVNTPKDALVVEAVAQQWQWSFRLPGQDGEFGKTSISLINFQNPFGIDPEDPNGQDDVLVPGNEIHLPLNRPVKVLLRSKDVLHDFYVPEFRVKMDAIPGAISSLWFTPTKAGTYELACAEYCGLGHHTMRGVVVVEAQQTFQDWVAAQAIFSEEVAEAGTNTGQDPVVVLGQQLAQTKGCLGCHTTDGTPSVGPSWKGLFGKQESLSDGTTVAVDEAYLAESIADPSAKVVENFPPAMPPYTLNEEDLEAIIAYIKSLTGND